MAKTFWVFVCLAMFKFIIYLAISFAALIFCFWFISWGSQQGAVSSIEQVPGIFSISNIVGSVLFFGSGWIVLRKGLKNSFLILIGIFTWFLSVVVLGRIGFFAMRPLFAPNLVFAFLILFILGKKILSVGSFQEAFNKTPLDKVFLVQTFRVMGVAFLSLYLMRVLPGEFAIATGVGDIIIGASAPIVAYIYSLQKSFSKSVALIWNWAGIFDLAIAITSGILTYPEPLQVVATEVSNLPIALYPLVIIPVFAVPYSVLIHIFSIRALNKAAS